MTKRVSKSKAVLSVLGRLGFHARTESVLAELARYGIDASAGLVQRVKIDVVKDSRGIRQWKAKAAADLHPRVRGLRKIPPRRM